MMTDFENLIIWFQFLLHIMQKLCNVLHEDQSYKKIMIIMNTVSS